MFTTMRKPDDYSSEEILDGIASAGGRRFYKGPSAALYDRRLRRLGSVRDVLGVICDHTENGLARISAARISAALRISARQVLRCLKELERVGYLKVTRGIGRRRRSNEYEVLYPTLLSEDDVRGYGIPRIKSSTAPPG